MKKSIILIVAIFFYTAMAIHAQSVIDTYIQNYMSTNKITGMSASVIKNGKMVWTKHMELPTEKQVNQ